MSDQHIYDPVAIEFARLIENLFMSEDSLKTAWEATFPLTPFDRTGRWGLVLAKELNRVWRQHGPDVVGNITPHDTHRVLDMLMVHLDYNLWSQVHLNLQPQWIARYASEETGAEFDAITKKYAGKSPSPFDTKAKMFRAAVKGEEIEFNRDLSQLKALRIIAQAEPGANSYRVSPKGSTPALADFSNLSMLGVGADRYLRTHPSLNVFYLCWENAPQMVTPVSGNEFEAKEISDYRFTSNSGGDILNTVLYARYLMFQLAHDIKDLHTSFFLPRMNSLLVVAGETEAEMRDILPPYGNPQLVVGSR